MGIDLRDRLSVPLYTPAALLRGMDERLADVTPLYAGRCVADITALRAASEVVAEIAAGVRADASPLTGS